MIELRDRIKIQQVLDQENAGIADVLSCQEYLHLLWVSISSAIRGLNETVARVDASPEMNAIINWNIIDLTTVLRLAQVKLAEIVLQQDEEIADA